MVYIRGLNRRYNPVSDEQMEYGIHEHSALRVLQPAR